MSATTQPASSQLEKYSCSFSVKNIKNLHKLLGISMSMISQKTGITLTPKMAAGLCAAVLLVACSIVGGFVLHSEQQKSNGPDELRTIYTFVNAGKGNSSAVQQTGDQDWPPTEQIPFGSQEIQSSNNTSKLNKPARSLIAIGRHIIVNSSHLVAQQLQMGLTDMAKVKPLNMARPAGYRMSTTTGQQPDTTTTMSPNVGKSGDRSTKATPTSKRRMTETEILLRKLANEILIKLFEKFVLKAAALKSQAEAATTQVTPIRQAEPDRRATTTARPVSIGWTVNQPITPSVHRKPEKPKITQSLATNGVRLPESRQMALPKTQPQHTNRQTMAGSAVSVPEIIIAQRGERIAAPKSSPRLPVSRPSITAESMLGILPISAMLPVQPVPVTSSTLPNKPQSTSPNLLQQLRMQMFRRYFLRREYEGAEERGLFGPEF